MKDWLFKALKLFKGNSSKRHMMRIILVFTVFFFAALVEANIWDDFFKPDFSSGPSFSDSQLYSIGLGLQNVYGTLGAFGDFNSDK